MMRDFTNVAEGMVGRQQYHVWKKEVKVTIGFYGISLDRYENLKKPLALRKIKTSYDWSLPARAFTDHIILTNLQTLISGNQTVRRSYEEICFFLNDRWSSDHSIQLSSLKK
jgi:hypothetical protein